MAFGRDRDPFMFSESQNVYVDANIISKFITKTFIWMFLGLVVTIATAALVLMTPEVFRFFFGNGFAPLFMIMLLEMGLAFYLSAAVHKLSLSSSRILFMLFSVLNGISLSVLGLGDLTLLFGVLGLTTLIFAVMAVYGYVTKEDLSKFGPLLNVGLIILIISSVLNMFLHLPAMNLVICYIGAAIFIALIGYDVNKLKRIATFAAGNGSTELIEKFSVVGALQLYLDFINLFLYLYRIFESGKRRD